LAGYPNQWTLKR